MKFKFHRSLIWSAVALAVVSFLGAWFNLRAFFQAWLTGWMFWSGLSFGGLLLFMLQALTGGAWAQAARGPSLALIGTVPSSAVLFIPVLIGAGWIYPWMNREIFSHHHWPHKEAWFTFPFFAIRSLIILGALTTLAILLRAWSSGEGSRMRVLSSAGSILYFLLMTIAATDWVMSLTPQWYSTIFSTILMAAQFLSALALVILARCRMGNASSKAYHDLGNLLLAFVIFWAYVSFSQFLLIWIGNLPREIDWYLLRNSGGWLIIVIILAAIQFFLPFFALLSRQSKHMPQRLQWIAGCVFCASILNFFWLIKPSFSTQLSISWLDIVIFLTIGLIWMSVFLYHLSLGTVSETKQNV